MKTQASALKIAFLLSYICIASITAALLTPALPMIAAHFHLHHGETAYVVSIFLVGYVIGQLIYGPLSHRIGVLNALRIGLVLGILGVVLSLVAVPHAHYTLFLLGRFVCALGTASGLSCTFILLHDQLDDKQCKHTMAFAVVAFTFGIGLAVLCGGILTTHLGWSYCLWALLIYIGVMALGTFSIRLNDEHHEAIHPILIMKKLSHALTHGRLIIFALVVGVCSAFGYLYAACAPLIAANYLHLNPSQYGSWNCLNMIGMAGSGFMGAYLMKKVAVAKIVWLGLIGTVLCVLLGCLYSVTHSHSSLLFFMITTAFYFLGGLLFPSGSYLALENTTDKQSGSSAMSFINMGSATIIVFALSFLSLSPLHALMMVMGLFTLLVGLLVLIHQIRCRKKQAIQFTHY
jgi:MFS family permease